MPVLIFL